MDLAPPTLPDARDHEINKNFKAIFPTGSTKEVCWRIQSTLSRDRLYILRSVRKGLMVRQEGPDGPSSLHPLGQEETQ